MANTVVYVGGPSRAGKSYFSRLLAKELGFDYIDLDKDRSIVKIRAQYKNPERSQRLKERGLQLIAGTRTDAVIEGSPLWPRDLEKMPPPRCSILPVYVGFPTATVDAKLRSIEETRFENALHLQRLPEAKLRARIQDYIDQSIRLEDKCRRRGFFFGDFSDMDNLSRDQQALADRIRDYLEDERRTGRARRMRDQASANQER